MGYERITNVRPRPWVLVLVAALACALAFPRVAAGSIGLVILAGAAGIGIARNWGRLAGCREVSPRAAGWLAITVVLLASALIFGPVLAHSLMWLHGGWPAAAVASGVLIAWGALASLAPARSLKLGNGLRATADVSIRRVDGPWEPCDYAPGLGEYHCADRAIVTDGTAAIVNDEQPLWPYTTPAIYVRLSQPADLEVRVEMHRRLAGRYRAGSQGKPATIAISGVAPVTTDAQRTIELEDGDHAITITAPVALTGEWITFVREDTLDPDRTVPLAPQDAPSR